MPAIHGILDTLLGRLRGAAGSDVDINNLALRYAMDVTGAVCFGVEFGTADAFDDSHTNDLFAVLRGGAHGLLHWGAVGCGAGLGSSAPRWSFCLPVCMRRGRRRRRRRVCLRRGRRSCDVFSGVHELQHL